MKKNYTPNLKNLVAMKDFIFLRLMSLLFVLCSTLGFSQDFNFTITDANMTVQVSATVGGSVLENGDLLGAFFTNASGDLQNAGYGTYSGDQMAIAVWASESGLNNGFATGETINWIMYDSSESVAVELDAEMNAVGLFTDVYAPNGLAQILSLEVAVASTCEDTPGAFNGLGCASAQSFFGCDAVMGGILVSDECPQTCDACGGSSEPVLGCTDENADNYDSLATEDNGSCEFSGCMDLSAINYDSSANVSDAASCAYPGPMTFGITDANMTVQVGAAVVTINGAAPPVGSLLGAYYENNSGEFVNAGYGEWTGDQLAIAVWASESGLDNGFETGEVITWVLQVGTDLFVADAVQMNDTFPFTDVYAPNGLGQIISASFSGTVTRCTRLYG
jgi:hypothetical protein